MSPCLVCGQEHNVVITCPNASITFEQSLEDTPLSRLAALERELAEARQRHAEAVEAAYREGLREPSGDPDEYSLSDDELWLASSAKKGLEGA